MKKHVMIFLLGSFLYNILMVKTLLGLDDTSMFAGASYNCGMLAYGVMILLFGVCLLGNFGAGDKLTNPYGVLKIVRNEGRIKVVIKFIVEEMIRAIVVTCVVYLTYKITIGLMDKNINDVDYKEVYRYIALFTVVIFSLFLLQSIFEMIWDSRIAIVIILGIVLCQLLLGDTVYINLYDERWNLVLFSNLALGARRTILNIEPEIMLGISALWAVIILTGLVIIFCKKDIIEKE